MNSTLLFSLSQKPGKLRPQSLTSRLSNTACRMMLILSVWIIAQTKASASVWPLPQQLTVTFPYGSPTLELDAYGGTYNWSESHSNEPTGNGVFSSSASISVTLDSSFSISYQYDYTDNDDSANNTSTSYSFSGMVARVNGNGFEVRDQWGSATSEVSVSGSWPNATTTPISGVWHISDAGDPWTYVFTTDSSTDWYSRDSGGNSALTITNNGYGTPIFTIYDGDGNWVNGGTYSNSVFSNGQPLWMSPRDQNGSLISTGSPSNISSSVTGIWIAGTTFYFQGTDFSYPTTDVFASQSGGVLVVASGGGLSGNAFIPNSRTFSGTFVENSFFDITYSDSTTGPFGYGGPNPSIDLTGLPAEHPPALNVNGQIWNWIGNFNSVSYYMMLSGAEPDTWLGLPNGASSTGTFSGLISGSVNFSNGAFQDGPATVRSVYGDGSIWTPVTLPLPSYPLAVSVQGDVWWPLYSVSQDATADNGSAFYAGSSSSQVLTLSWAMQFDENNNPTGISYTFSVTNPGNDSGTYSGPTDDFTNSIWGIQPNWPNIARWLDVRTVDNFGNPLSTGIATFGPPHAIIVNGSYWWFTHRPESENHADIYTNNAAPNSSQQTLWVDPSGYVTTDSLQRIGRYNQGRFQSVTSGWTLEPYWINIASPGSGHPNVLTINGQTWTRGTTSNGMQDVYLGAVDGQQLVISGNGTVSYNNPALNISGAIGTFASNEFSFATDLPDTHTIASNGTTTTGSGRWRDNSPIIVQNGSLDIQGNTISLGALFNAPNTAGLTVTFQDTTRGSNLHQMLTRPTTSWWWDHGTSTGQVNPMMKLDESSILSLYPSNYTVGTNPTVKLDPNGISTIPGLNLTGNLQGTGTNNTLANQQVSSLASILTKGLADGLYATTSAINGKANTADVYPKTQTYNKTEVDALIGTGGSNNVYTKPQTDALLAPKANSVDVYTKTVVDSLLAGVWPKTQTYSRTEVDAALATKVNGADVYTKTQTYSKTEVDAKIGTVPTNVYTKTETDALVAPKANSANVYTKAEVDTQVGGKANSADVYTKTFIDGLLAGVYTKTQVDALVGTKANSADVYTKTEVDTQVGAKANSANVFTKAESDGRFLPLSGGVVAGGLTTNSLQVGGTSNGVTVTNTTTASTVTVHGVLRVRAAGDVSMGAFTTVPAGQTTP